MLGNPATGSEAFFGNTVVKATAEVCCSADSLARGRQGVSGKSTPLSSEHLGVASGHCCVTSTD